MSNLRTKNVIKYVAPAILSGVCFFLFTGIDAIFVGRGIGTYALGAMNLIGPFILKVAQKSKNYRYKMVMLFFEKGRCGCLMQCKADVTWRTETAGMAVLAIMMFQMQGA